MKITGKDRAFFHLLLAPGMLILILFAYLPMVGIVIAFQEFNPTKGFIFRNGSGLSTSAFCSSCRTRCKPSATRSRFP